jgi:hypothetical protein
MMKQREHRNAEAALGNLAFGLPPDAVGDALYDHSAGLLASGYPRDALYGDLERLAAEMRSRGEEEREDGILDVMDALEGECAPSSRL